MKGLRIGGHPLHPALVHFPIACWTAAPLLDGISLLGHDPAWWHLAFWCITAGLITGVAAMGAGFMDLLALPVGHPAQRTGQRHLLLMGGAWCIFIIDLLGHSLQGLPASGEVWLGLSLSLAGFCVLLAGAYAGAQLVYAFGVGQIQHHDKT
ncbi:MAG: DUF2231 domain-containing protein [Gammaproteobacteria bacterium]|nr:DUF2231 domain-containing protein [Gammaproteobacteria bacterium]